MGQPFICFHGIGFEFGGDLSQIKLKQKGVLSLSFKRAKYNPLLVIDVCRNCIDLDCYTISTIV